MKISISISTSKLPFYRDCTMFSQAECFQKGGLNDCIDKRIDISYKTFRSKVNDTDWNEIVKALGYDRSFKIQDDYAVQFCRSKLFGKTVYMLRHSSIEYIFSN